MQHAAESIIYLNMEQGAAQVDPEHKCPSESGVKVIGDPFNCHSSLICVEGQITETLFCEEASPVS